VDFQFLTYTADNGFVNAGFDGIRTGNIAAAGQIIVPTERTITNAALTFNAAGLGLGLDTYALRLETGDIAFGAGITPAATDRIQVRSGGLIINGARTIAPGISFGTAPQEANIFNNNNLVIGTLATTGNTTGQITNATNIVKHGGGNLFIDAKQDSFSGNYIVNQGSIFFRSIAVQTNLGGTATLAQMNAGTNGLVVLNGFGSNLGVRSDVANTVYNLGLVIGEGNPYAVLNNDRAAGTANVLSILTGGIRFGGSPGEQGQTLFVSNPANNVGIQVNGPLVLSAATMEGAPAYNFIRTDPNLTVYGNVSGGAALIHTGGGTLELGNGFTGFANGINTFTGGIQNVQGTVNVRGTTTGTPANFATLFSGINNGGIGSGDITMYSGTLNLFIDGANTTTRERYVVGNNATGNNLIINGSSTVTANRNIAGTAANKHLAFKDLTIGSSTLTVTAGNGYILEINGATNLTGIPLLNIGNTLLLNGTVNDGAGSVAGTQGQAIIKGGGGDLWLNSPNSTFGGLYAGTAGANGLGIVVNGGLLRFGDVNSENGTAMNLDTMLRGSTIRINPTGGIFLTNPANVNFGTGQVELLSSGSQMGLFRMSNAAFNQAYLQNALSSNSNGVLALNASIANPLNLATIGNGRSFFGATANADYTAETLGVGADNLYRIGGGGARLNFDSPAVIGVFVEGATPGTRVLFGNQAVNGNSGETDLRDIYTYTGGTIISRSSSLLTRTATSGANGPLGNGGAVDIFGQVRLYSGATLRNFAGTANQYTVNLHPGGVLWLDNEGGIQNRYDDNTALNLNGGQLFLRAENNAATTTNEVIGAVGFSRGSSLRVDRRITNGAVQLTMADLTRSGVGSTLAIVTNAAFLGVNAGNDEVERIKVSAWDATLPTLSGNTIRNGTPGFANNGILPAYYIDATSNTFLSYNSTSGFQSVLSTLTPATNQVAYSNIFAGGVFSTNTNANSVVDITTAAMVLTQDQTVYALRTSQNISSGVGQYNTLTFADGATDAERGGLITTGTPTIATNLRFGTTGTKEGIIFTAGNTILSGDIYAGSLTKFGGSTLTIGKDQTAAANGTGFAGNWTVNGGALTLNTLGASGDGGTITLNSSSTTTGAGTTLNLVANPGSSLNGQYTMGRIIGVDNAIVAVNVGIADSAVGISDLESFSTDTTGLSPARLRVTVANTRSVLNAGTLHLTGTGNSIIDINAAAVNNQITSGATGAGLNVSGLNGSRDLIKWGNGYLWVGGNNSTSFTGDVYIEQGAIGVTNANAFANAGTSITARRYGVLDILTSGFNKAVTYEAGSIERWSVDNARSGTINLGAGSLQVNADQNTTSATIQINGGAIEGFLRTDDVSNGNNGLVFRTLGTGVSINLLGNSFVGQNAFTDGPNGTDNGRTQDLTTGVGPDTNNNSELVAAARGAILEIKGNISGAGGLTKQSSDTVILSGTNTYGGSTNVANGTLRLGSNTALPTGNNVTTSGRGVLDLGGNNASVGNLNSSTITGALIPSGSTFASNGGFITNSSTVQKTLTVTPTATSTYAGVVQNNVAVTKAGGQKLIFTNVNTYTGETNVNGGILEVTHATGSAGSAAIDGISGTSKLTVANGATFNLVTGSIGGTLTLAGTSGTTLELAGGSRLGVEVGPNTGTNAGSGAGQNTGSSIRLQPGAKALVTGNVAVDAYFLPGIVTHAGKSDILVAQGGGLVSTNGSTGSYSIGNLYNVTNFTVTGITATDTLVQFDVAAATALTAAYWKGGFSGGSNVWAVSNGSTQSNWATDLAGTNTGLVPAATTNVFLSVTSPTDQNNMVLGSNMSINSLTLNNTSGTPVLLQNTGDFTLSIGGTAAITSDVGSGTATFNNKIALTNAAPTIAVNSANTLTLAGPVSGATISLTKTGTGTLVLSGTNTYTGATNINAGILSAANDLALGTAPGNTTVANKGSLELQGNVTIAFEALGLTGDGATVGADTSGGALRNLSGNNIVTGAVTLAAATTVQSDAGTLNINGGITGAFPLTVEGAGNTTINGIVGTAAGTIIKNDAGTLTLNNANTYTGATTINGGTVVVSNALGLGTVAGGATVAAGATLNISGVTVAETPVTLNGAGFGGNGALSGTGTATMSGASVVMATSSSVGAAIASDILTISGVISGTGSNLTKVGGGKVILSAASANTYTGTTTISGGTLQLGDGGTAGSLNTASTISVGTGAVFAVNQTDTVTQGTDFSASAITGAGGFAQTGTGTTVLSTTDNSYSGGTSVTDGELRVTGSLTGAGAVTVGETGGTLIPANAAILAGAGNGTTTGVIAGALTVGGPTSDGILAPGATPAAIGTLTLTSAGTALTVANGSQIQMGITTATVAADAGILGALTAANYVSASNYITNTTPSWAATSGVTPGNHDYLNLTTGSISLGTRSSGTLGNGTVSITSLGGYTGVQGDVFNLLDWQSVTMSGTFTAANGGNFFTNGGVWGDLDLPTLTSQLFWDTSAFASHGVLVVVPEPSRMLLLLVGLLGLFFRRRRRVGSV
jgi:autotransporter-associated beta strand protein